MPKKTPLRRAADPPVGIKKKKLVQTKLDVHFSFRSSSTSMEGGKEFEPSNVGEETRREGGNAADSTWGTTSKVNVDGSPTPSDSPDLPSESFDEANKNKADTMPKSHFWDDDDEDKAGSSKKDGTNESPDDSQRVTFLGPPLDSFRRPAMPLSRLTASSEHTILFDTSTVQNVASGVSPSPYPRHHYDKWHSNYVRMPCSDKNEYPVNENKLVKRWDLINEALTTTWSTFDDLKTSIMSYNDRYASSWDFSGLQRYIEKMEDEERDALFTTTLPKMATLALQLPEIITQPIPLLKCGMSHTVSMTQQQAACLLANAFFCTFPRRNQLRSGAEFANYPEINFRGVFRNDRIANVKLDFIFNYFRRVTERMPGGVLSFERFSLDAFPDWSMSQAALTKLHISRKGTIEDFGEGMLQVDFANKFLGGGVLGRGSVQEEIRFLICPEMIVSMLFTEALAHNECLIMRGCERFSYYAGYGGSLQWLQSFEDTTPRDKWGRRLVEVVAIDALPVSNFYEQFNKDDIGRELDKGYCGFVRPGVDPNILSPVATGNWGCGAFGGDKELKSLIQLMAAAEAGRDVVYFTFDDHQLMQRIYDMYEFLVCAKRTVGSIYDLLMRYCNYVATSTDKPVPLFDYIYRNI